MQGTFVPSFFLQENYGSRDQRTHEVVITDDAITDMCNRGRFLHHLHIDALYQSSMTRLSICLQPDSYGSYRDPIEPLLSISGFPRELCTQDTIPSNLDEVGESDGDGDVSELSATPVLPPLPHANTEPDTSRLQGPRRLFNRRRLKSDQESGLYKSKKWSTARIPTREKSTSTLLQATKSKENIETSSIDLLDAASSKSTVSSGDTRFSADQTNAGSRPPSGDDDAMLNDNW